MKLSGYTSCRNALEMMYPLEESITSALSFCDEVCVLDSSDKDDGTKQKLLDLQEKFKGKLKIHHENIDWKAPNHGIFDGMTKQMAREMCSSQFLLQFDIDEIFHENHAGLYKPLIQNYGANWYKVPIVALPVVEYWGPSGKIRIDINLWKWRVSMNVKDITHGIPGHLRQIDQKTGLLYSKPGSDSCDLISKASLEPYPCSGFIPKEIEEKRVRASRGSDLNALADVEQWYSKTLETLPGVFHYSWFDIERKIKQYKLFWSSFWKALYNETRDERENPFFPGLTWAEISDEMIKTYAKELENSTVGHIFHSPYNGKKTNGIKIDMDHPQIVKEWTEKIKR